MKELKVLAMAIGVRRISACDYRGWQHTVDLLAKFQTG